MRIKNVIKFSVLSVLGFVFFLVPMPIMGETKIMISQIKRFFISENVLSSFLMLTQIIAVAVAILTLVFVFYTSRKEWINNVFKCGILNVFARIFGSFLYLMVINQWFNNFEIAQAINSSDVGQVLVGAEGLITTLYITFFVGILALPLLTHFGAVEFVGTLVAPFVRKIFRVPGYAAVDAIASFVGDGTIGIVVTDRQYQRGYYTRREAYIIATSFSIVGIAFAAAVAEELELGRVFPIFYGSIALVTVILAIITSRLKLRKYKNEYYKGATSHNMSDESKKGIFKHAVNLASEQAGKTKISKATVESLQHILAIYVGFIPVIMVVGTTGLLIAEKTMLFTYIAKPFEILYNFVGFSEANSALMAPASIVGIADMYLPALFIKESASEFVKFAIGVLAFTQLVFMSETGMVLVKSKIGLNLWDVIKVFIYRTILSIPLVFGISYLLYYFGVLVS